MKIRIIYLLLILPIKHFSQSRERLILNDLEIMNLKGSVKEIKERTFEVNGNKLTFDNGVIIPVSFNYYFDTKGYIKYKEGIEILENKEIISTKQYFTFDKNKITKDFYLITKFIDADSINHIYNYPNDSIRLKISTGKSYKGLTEKTIQRGNIDIIELYYPGEKILETKEIKYNNNNKIISIDSNGFGEKETILRTYNSTCNDFANEKTISIKYKVNSIENRVFDKSCNIIKKEFQDKNSKLLILKFTYTFDEKGNWIERKSYNFAGKLYLLTKREITYY